MSFSMLRQTPVLSRNSKLIGKRPCCESAIVFLGLPRSSEASRRFGLLFHGASNPTQANSRGFLRCFRTFLQSYGQSLGSRRDATPY